MRLAYLVLAHDHPELLPRLINRLTAEDDLVVVHWDKKNAFDIRGHLAAQLPERSSRRLRVARQVDVQWGLWSMVEATLSCLEEVRQSGEQVDYVVLISGADYPIRPLSHLKAFLAADPGREYMEFVDPMIDPWVIKGLSSERYEYRHFVSWRDHPKLFGYFWHAQRILRLKRKMPAGLKAYFGSQWWALTWGSALRALEMSRMPAIRDFFRTTWVPDEMYFQTIVASLVPPEKIGPFGLTLYHFTSQGKPILFYNDHFEFLIRQEFFFARKLSPHAQALRDRLDQHADATRNTPVPTIRLKKDTSDFDYFEGMQQRGLPDRRAVGRVGDPWYGDLEWSRHPYFVLVAPDGMDVEPLREALNRIPGVLCFNELFHPDRIDYGLPGQEHPSYQEDDHLARELKRPNFLSDLIHHHRDRLIGCVMRVPPHHEMIDVVTYDPWAYVIVCMPPLPEPAEGLSSAYWQAGHAYMTMSDRLTKVVAAGKPHWQVQLRDAQWRPDQLAALTQTLREWMARQSLRL